MSFLKQTTLLMGLLFWALTLEGTETTSPPPCKNNKGKELPLNGFQVIEWKHTTANKFEGRAHLKGTVSKIYPDKNGHRHFQMIFNDVKNNEDTIEVIYNESFGKISEIEIDMTVETCGDYITTTKQNGPYPPSPDGAIVHWVHENPSGKGHPDGYVTLNGVLYGFGGKKRVR